MKSPAQADSSGSGGLRLWPLIPAAVLAVIGLTQLGYPEFGRVWREARDYWPYALIALGLALLFNLPRRK